MTAPPPTDRPHGRPAPIGAPRRRRDPRSLLWVVLAAMIGFVIGAGWQYVGSQAVARQASYTARALEAARLEATLSGAVIDAQAGSFELGRQRTSAFFSGVQRRLAPALAEQPAAEARQLMGERDAIITALARNDPASASVLSQLLTRYRTVMNQAGLDSVVAAPSPR